MSDFQLLKVIGKGGFSKVLLVRKKDSGLLFAMKVMEKSFVTGDGKFRQVMCERNIMEVLNHPFMVKLHWAFQSRDELNFVMDLCAGGELFYLLHQRGKMIESSAKFYFAEILLGLEYIHSKGIVYRDLKPENVLLDIDGHIKLADFGLSKHLSSISDLTNSFCGSPEYMSPEMLIGQGHGFAVDYYSLGAILFEMLTGLPPFYQTDRNQMYFDIVEADLEYPDYLNPVVVDLLNRLLCKDQMKRYSYQHINKIKSHPWCQDIQWQQLLNKQIHPPWLPDITKSNFDPDYTTLPVDMKATDQSEVGGKLLNKGRRHAQRSIYCCMDQSAMTSFYDNTTMLAETSGFLNHNNQQSCYYESGHPTHQLINMHSSRAKLLEVSGNQSLFLKSPKTGGIKDHEKIEQMFKGFSFYSEPVEEREVQRQIKEYLKLKEQFKKKSLQGKIKTQKYEDLKQQVRGEIPPKAQKRDPNLKINSMKNAAQAISVLNQQQSLKSLHPLQNDRDPISNLSPIRPQNLINQIRLENSMIVEEEISIAQEFSRIEEETDVDELPKPRDQMINKVKINHTTENSLTRVNQITQRVFDSYSQRNLSPYINKGSIQTTAAKQNQDQNKLKNSNDNTPFNYYKLEQHTQNNSVVSSQVNNPDNSSKKPKFLQKYSGYLTKKDKEKKNLLKEFSPIQAKQQSMMIVNQNSKTFSSQWCSPNKISSLERNTFATDYAQHGGNQMKQFNQNVTQCTSISRNNSGTIGLSISNYNHTTNNQRASLASGECNMQSMVYQSSQGNEETERGSIKSRNAQHNFGTSQSQVRSQESAQAFRKPSNLILKQKTSQALNLTPLSSIENAQQDLQNYRVNLVQQSFSQKPPRQIPAPNGLQSNSLSRQVSVNYGSQIQSSTISSLTTYQKSKAALVHTKNYSTHSSLNRKPSTNPINDSEASTNLINSNGLPFSANTTQNIQSISSNKQKYLSQNNLNQNISNFEKTSQVQPQSQMIATPKQHNYQSQLSLYPSSNLSQRQLANNNSLSQKRKQQQSTMQQQYVSSYSNSVVQNTSTQIVNVSSPNTNSKPYISSGTQSQYHSVLDTGTPIPVFTNEYQIETGSQENTNLLMQMSNDLFNQHQSFKFTPQTTTNSQVSQTSRPSYRTFSKEKENLSSPFGQMQQTQEINQNKNTFLALQKNCQSSSNNRQQATMPQNSLSSSSLISTQTMTSSITAAQVNRQQTLPQKVTQHPNDMYYKKSSQNLDCNSFSQRSIQKQGTFSSERGFNKQRLSSSKGKRSQNDNTNNMHMTLQPSTLQTVMHNQSLSSFGSLAATNSNLRPSSGKNMKPTPRSNYLTLK